ncbi:MAG: hypothetical protein HQK75_02165 [Candidatus Magnetomorum sp.]|nr:hypothetical protein [Candidatus Magnetomorum sp.]
MSNPINEKDMIDAFKESLEAKDMIKTRVILSYIENVNRKVQNRLLFELVRVDVNFHLPLLIYLMNQHQAFCQAFPIIEETLIAHAIDYPESFANALNAEAVTDSTILIAIAEKAKEKQQVK